MTPEIQSLISLGPTVVLVALFLMYLQKKDERNESTYSNFNTTIQKHLKESNKVIKDGNKINQDLAIKLNDLSMSSDKLSVTNKDLSRIIKEMYDKLVSNRRTILKMENDKGRTTTAISE